MNDQITILGIAGSLRQGSFNRGALRAASELVPDGAKMEIVELDGIPGFNQDDEGNPPEKVAELKRKIRGVERQTGSDNVLTVTGGDIVYGAEEFGAFTPGLPPVSPAW